MNETPPTSGKDPLSKTLREWKIEASLPPGFQAQVWRRIEAAETTRADVSFGAWLVSLMQGLVRPKFALAYVTALLMVGLTLGYWQSERRTAEWDSAMAGRYISAVDPLQQTR
ncbi:MAG: hypothetical protein AB1705_05355 [Verrucomicrobiota bacterium]